jgi:hypothetical protein
LLKEIATSALMIFFDKDSILTILLMVGGSLKISCPKLAFGVVATFLFSWIIFRRNLMINWQVSKRPSLYVVDQPMGG